MGTRDAERRGARREPGASLPDGGAANSRSGDGPACGAGQRRPRIARVLKLLGTA
jgi:hypothetical protein